MTSFEFLAQNEEDTARLGAALALHLPPGTTLALQGTLGAGKTRLVQAIAAACQVPQQQVVSPTFTLCNEYQGTRKLYHLDVYRVADEDEFWELGPEEYFDSDGLTLVEWADRFEQFLPEERIEIVIQVEGLTQRRFRITSVAPRLAPTVAALQQALQA